MIMTKTASDPTPADAAAPKSVDPTSDSFGTKLVKSAKSIAKLALSTHRATFNREERNGPILILGNGPSLADTIRDLTPEKIAAMTTMAVNFAANAPEFKSLRPDYYIPADPHFFANPGDANVARLLDNLQNVSWPMTLLLPFGAHKSCSLRPTEHLAIEYYNAVGIEGFQWLCDCAFSHRRGMPRPRNVLIPAIMTAIGLGYKEIYIAGADHTWTATLSVDDDNNVVSIQPHFYKEDDKEVQRIRKEYHKYPLHSILYSFYVAFKAYHQISGYAMRHGVSICNATPGSMIDAFPRRLLGGEASASHKSPQC